MTGLVEIVLQPFAGELDDGGRCDGLRMRYRHAGARSWSKAIVLASPGQSLLDLIGAALAVVASSETRVDGGAPAGAQLQLGGAIA